MSLFVRVFINRTEVVELSARRLTPLKGVDCEHDYITNMGDVIQHKYSDGAEVLAIKLLDKYKIKR